MSRELKIALGVGVALWMLVCVGVVAAYLILPQAVKRPPAVDTPTVYIESEVVDFELPLGYKKIVARNTSTVAVIPLQSADALVIVFRILPEELVRYEDAEREMRQIWVGLGNRSDVDMHTVGTQRAEIRGKVTDLMVSEGSDASGQVVRQITGIFQSRYSTKVMLVAIGATDSWDQKTLNDFLASIK